MTLSTKEFNLLSFVSVLFLTLVWLFLPLSFIKPTAVLFSSWCRSTIDDILKIFFQTVVPLQNNNGSFLSYLKPLFQSEAKCETINMNIIFNSHVNLTDFQIKGFTLSLTSKYRVFGTGNSLFNWWNKSLLPSILCEVAPVPSHNIQTLHFFHFIKGA